jgi:hypothetical protein
MNDEILFMAVIIAPLLDSLSIRPQYIRYKHSFLEMNQQGSKCGSLMPDV